MKKTHSISAFLAGVLAPLLLTSAVPSAVAASGRSVTIFPGVTIYLDDVKLDPTDANGKPVEAFIYNGTTYLPVRAVSEALGKPVQWDGKTHSVYIGKHSSDKPAVMLRDLDYFSGDHTLYYADSQNDNTGVTHLNCITRGLDRTYLIDGQYSALSGVLYQKYGWRAMSGEVKLNVYGDGALIYSYTYDGTGLRPVPFNVDLTGVLELRVKFTTTERYSNDSDAYSGVFALGDVGLWT